MIAAVIFDLDGLLIDSEQVWDDVRRDFVAERGGRWHDRAQRDMMGMSSPEWSRYLSEELGVEGTPESLSEEVAGRVAASYRERLPLMPGARETVQRLADRWRLGLATSSNREVIDLVLDAAGLAGFFEATVSSEEVQRGKPAPDVYLETAHRLGVKPSRCVAIEDSHNGIFSADSAGMPVIAIPNRLFPPGEEARKKAVEVLSSLDDLTEEVVAAL